MGHKSDRSKRTHEATKFHERFDLPGLPYFRAVKLKLPRIILLPLMFRDLPYYDRFRRQY